MEEELKKKLHHRLLSFERKYKEWEWSDVIKWLSGLKQVIDKIETNNITEDLFILVSKRLAQCLNPSLPQGLHAETLKIYSTLLEKSTSARYKLLLSSGLFQHFQSCAPQNKIQFLSIITRTFLNQQDLELSMPGLVACLLSGAGDKQETLTKVFEILDSIENKQMLHFCVWNFVMKSSDFRNVGLMYMQKRTQREYCEEIIVNTLLQSLEDGKVINKRLTLDIIKNFFPIKEKNLIIVTLMHGVLKLFKGKDYSLTRRLWEWAFPEELNSSQVGLIREVLAEALQLIFSENHGIIMENQENAAETQMASLKIVEEVCECEEIGDGFMKEISNIFLKHCIEDKLYEVPNNKLKPILERHREYLWQAVLAVLNQNLLRNEQECIELLGFADKYLEHSNDHSLQICIKICQHLHKIEYFPEFLRLLKLFLSKSIIPSDFSLKLKHVKKKFTHLVKYNKEQALIDYIYIITTFVKDQAELTQFVSYLKLLSGKNITLTLKGLLMFEEKSLTEEDFEALWTHVNVNDTELLDVLLKSYDTFPEQWTNGFISLLIAQSRENYIKVFITFWGYASKINQDVLLRISRGGKLVFIMIELLSDDNPSMRHSAREWLNLATRTPACLFDPILIMLLHHSTIRKVDDQLNWSYINNFDSLTILDVFGKVVSLLLHSHNLLSTMQECGMTNNTKKLMEDHGIEAGTYYELMIEVCFFYIKTENSFYNSDNFKVQCSATEVLRILTLRVDEKYINKILEKSGEIVYKGLGGNLEYAMMPVIDVLFMQNANFLYPSKTADVMILGLRHDDYYLRQQWSKIICKALPSIFSSKFSEVLCNFISLLFINYCDMVSKFYDPTTIQGLSSLMKSCLNLIRSDKNKFKILKTLLFNEIERLFLLMINLKYPEEINAAIVEISETFPQEIVFSLVDLWQKHYEGQHKSAPIHKLIPKLGLSPDAIFDGILKSFELKKYNDIIIGNFTFTVIEKMYQSIKYETVWKKVLGIIKYLYESKWDESLAWVIKIVHILIGLVYPKSKSLLSLQKTFKNLVQKCQINILKWEKIACSPLVKLEGTTLLEVIFNELTYCQSLFRDVYKDKQKKMISIVTKLGKTLLDHIILIDTHADVISKLLSTLLISFPMIFESLKGILCETIKYSIFKIIFASPKCIEYWFDIINTIPKHSALQSLEVYDALFFKSSDVKLKLLERSYGLIGLAVLSGQKDAYTSFCPFILKRIEEAFKLETIPDSMFTLILILIRVLSCKFSNFSEIWSKLWPEIYSRIFHFFSENKVAVSYEVLKLIDTLLVTFEGFSYYLWMFLYDYPEIEFEIKDKKDEFVPMLSYFFKGFKAKPKHAQKSEYFSGPTSRCIRLNELTISNSDDLERYSKIIINYAMFYTTETLDADSKSAEKALHHEIIRVQSLID